MEGELNLGLTLEEGFGSARDVRAAAAWYHKAAAHGDAEAARRLGTLLLSGDGIPRDVAEAVRQLTFAAEHGDSVAQFTLGQMYLSGDGVPHDHAMAYALLTRAADGGLGSEQQRSSLRAKMTAAEVERAQQLLAGHRFEKEAVARPSHPAFFPIHERTQ
jgi:uncharacterized protein